MNALAIMIAAATVTVDYGWHRGQDGEWEYIIQVEPALVETLVRGQAIVSQMPPELRGVRRFRIQIGEGELPRQTLPPQGVLALEGWTPPGGVLNGNAAGGALNPWGTGRNSSNWRGPGQSPSGGAGGRSFDWLRENPLDPSARNTGRQFPEDPRLNSDPRLSGDPRYSASGDSRWNTNGPGRTTGWLGGPVGGAGGGGVGGVGSLGGTGAFGASGSPGSLTGASSWSSNNFNPLGSGGRFDYLNRPADRAWSRLDEGPDRAGARPGLGSAFDTFGPNFGNSQNGFAGGQAGANAPWNSQSNAAPAWQNGMPGGAGWPGGGNGAGGGANSGPWDANRWSGGAPPQMGPNPWGNGPQGQMGPMNDPHLAGSQFGGAQFGNPQFGGTQFGGGVPGGAMVATDAWGRPTANPTLEQFGPGRFDPRATPSGSYVDPRFQDPAAAGARFNDSRVARSSYDERLAETRTRNDGRSAGAAVSSTSSRSGAPHATISSQKSNGLNGLNKLKSDEKMWWPVTTTVILLFASLGGNFYLGWLAIDFYRRYRELAWEVRTSNSQQ